MDEAVREVLAGEEAWIVGGAIRDELLGRPVLDLDVACRDPRDAAHRYARRVGGAAFPLSERHGAWRVVVDGTERTVDFTPLPDGIEADLATRDFTLNAIAVPVEGSDRCDPHGGEGDLANGVVRAVSPTIFEDDPLRLLRAVRLEDELGLALDAETEALLRRSTALVTRAAGERILAELRRLSPSGFRRLAEVGLLAELGGTVDERLERLDDPDFRLVAVLGAKLAALPISNDLRRYANVLLRAQPPEDASPRSIHRFRRRTEPWALDALAFVGTSQLAPLVEAARRADSCSLNASAPRLSVWPATSMRTSG